MACIRCQLLISKYEPFVSIQILTCGVFLDKLSCNFLNSLTAVKSSSTLFSKEFRRCSILSSLGDFHEK